MRNILTALAITVAIGCALAAGIGIAIIGFPSTASANSLVQEMEPPRSKPGKGFVFQCSTLETFTYAMKKHGGKLVASNENPRRDRVISVIAFPDTSFGMFTYDPRSGQVCLLSTGWFVLPGSDA